jgi:DnaJ-class molecular chaperone
MRRCDCERGRTPCTLCNATGESRYFCGEPCGECRGAGEIKCPKCLGTGRIEDDEDVLILEDLGDG